MYHRKNTGYFFDFCAVFQYKFMIYCHSITSPLKTFSPTKVHIAIFNSSILCDWSNFFLIDIVRHGINRGKNPKTYLLIKS